MNISISIDNLKASDAQTENLEPRLKATPRQDP